VRGEDGSAKEEWRIKRPSTTKNTQRRIAGITVEKSSKSSKREEPSRNQGNLNNKKRNFQNTTWKIDVGREWGKSEGALSQILGAPLLEPFFTFLGKKKLKTPDLGSCLGLDGKGNVDNADSPSETDRESVN